MSLVLCLLAIVASHITGVYSQQNQPGLFINQNYNANQQQQQQRQGGGYQQNPQQQQQQSYQQQNQFQRQQQPQQQFQTRPNQQQNFHNVNAQRFQPFPKSFVPITSYKNDISYDGTFAYSYTTGDGQQQQAQGYLKNKGVKNLEAQVVQGSYSYTSPEGKPVSVSYIADENGFRAQGSSLPTPPPIPPEIRKSLELIARTQPVPASFQSQYGTGQYNSGQYNQQGGGYNQNQGGYQQGSGGGGGIPQPYQQPVGFSKYGWLLCAQLKTLDQFFSCYTVWYSS